LEDSTRARITISNPSRTLRWQDSPVVRLYSRSAGIATSINRARLGWAFAN
jgi:hypothetical protein